MNSIKTFRDLQLLEVSPLSNDESFWRCSPNLLCTPLLSISFDLRSRLVEEGSGFLAVEDDGLLTEVGSEAFAFS